MRAFAITLCACSQPSIPNFQSCLVNSRCQLVQSLTPFSSMDVNLFLCKVGSQDSPPCSLKSTRKTIHWKCYFRRAPSSSEITVTRYCRFVSQALHLTSVSSMRPSLTSWEVVWPAVLFSAFQQLASGRLIAHFEICSSNLQVFV